MKDATKKYTTTIRNHVYTFTAHTTKSGARLTVNESLNPCLVEVEVDGRTMYDAFALGHPIADDMEIIERCTLTANGYRWRTVESSPSVTGVKLQLANHSTAVISRHTDRMGAEQYMLHSAGGQSAQAPETPEEAALLAYAYETTEDLCAQVRERLAAQVAYMSRGER